MKTIRDFKSAMGRAEREYAVACDPEFSRRNDSLMGHKHKVARRRVGRIRRALGVINPEKFSKVERIHSLHKDGTINLETMNCTEMLAIVGNIFTPSDVAYARYKLDIRYKRDIGGCFKRRPDKTDLENAERSKLMQGWR